MRNALENKFGVTYTTDLEQSPRQVLNNEKILGLIGPLIPMADTIVDTVTNLISWRAVQIGGNTISQLPTKLQLPKLRLPYKGKEEL
jgi:hypothetical protein